MVLFSDSFSEFFFHFFRFCRFRCFFYSLARNAALKLYRKRYPPRFACVQKKIVMEFNESVKFNGDLPKFCQLINRLIKFVSIFI